VICWVDCDRPRTTLRLIDSEDDVKTYQGSDGCTYMFCEDAWSVMVDEQDEEDF
jgi:hypothetical protein